MDSTVGIVGYGRVGRAVEHVLARRGFRILVWDTDPHRAHGVRSPESLAAADVLFVCVPSWSVREALGSIAPHCTPPTMIVSFAKGIEAQTLAFMDEVVPASLAPGQPWGIAGGPMLAEDVLRDELAFLAFASDNRTARTRIGELFAGTTVRITVTSDVHGVAIGGVLKNIYATLLGIAQGLDVGANARGRLLLAAREEMCMLGEALGGSVAALGGIAGTGDLFATVLSPGSRNRSAGECITRGESPAPKTEGVHSLEPLIARLTREGVGTPLLVATLADIVLRGARPCPAVAELLAALP